MTYPPPATTPPPGWYPDPAEPEQWRWFDGRGWTPHTTPGRQAPHQQAPHQQVPHLAAPHPPAPGIGVSVLPGGRSHAPVAAAPLPPPVPVQAMPPGAYPDSPRVGAAPSDPVHWIVPLGRTWQSIVAGYVALFALVLWFLGPVALGFGIWALRASATGRGHGRGRAWFGIVVGTLSSVALVLMLVRGGF